MRSFIALLAISLAGLALAQVGSDFTSRTALIDDSAYVLGDLQPLPTGAGPVTKVEWSSLGTSAIITKFAERSEVLLLPNAPPQVKVIQCWSRKTGKVFDVDRVAADEYVVQANALGEGTVAVSMVKKLDDDTVTRFRIATASGFKETIVFPANGGDCEYTWSSDAPYVLAILSTGSEKEKNYQQTIRIFDGENSRWLLNTVRLESSLLVGWASYSSSDRSFILEIRRVGGKMSHHLSINPRTGQSAVIPEGLFNSRLTTALGRRENVPALPFEVVTQSRPHTGGHGLSELVLQRFRQAKGPPVIPVKPDVASRFALGVTNFDLTERGDGLLYVSEGVAYFRPIIVAKRDLLEARVLDESRADAVSRAKQLGLSLIMYADDNDDKWPTGDNIVEKLMPYVKNESLFDGFVYSYRGPATTVEVDDPDTTEIGYVLAPGGRAIIYADTRVEWKPDR